MLGYRFTSPSGWFLATFFFFLPWANLRCGPKGGPPTGSIPVSGKNLAWICVAEGVNKNNPAQDSTRGLVGGSLLTAYAIVLLVGIGLGLMLPLGRRRAFIGCGIGLLLLALQIAGCWVILGNPIGPSESNEYYTVWYHASHLANLLAITCFAIESRGNFARPSEEDLLTLESRFRTARPPMQTSDEIVLQPGSSVTGFQVMDVPP